MTDSQKKLRITARTGYEPHFSWSYLHPKNWGIWLGIFVLLLLAFVPFRLRDKMAEKLARALTKKIGKPRIRAEINLKLCFPDWTDDKRNKVIEDMFVTVAQVMLLAKLPFVLKNIYKNVANLLVLSISNKPKKKGITSF